MEQILKSSIEEGIKALYQHPKILLSITAAGAGYNASTWLFSIPNASSTILSIYFPYHRTAIQDFIHTYNPSTPSSSSSTFCSKPFSLLLAQAARNQAINIALKQTLIYNFNFKNKLPLLDINVDKLRDFQANTHKDAIVIGVGVTAVLKTQQEHKGEHRCFVSIADNFGREFTHTLILQKNKRSRQDEDILCSALIVSAIMQYVNTWANNGNEPLINIGYDVSSFDGVQYQYDENFAMDFAHHADSIIQEVSESKRRFCLLHSCLEKNELSYYNVPYFPIGTPINLLIFSGSFNPLHLAHERMALVAIEKLLSIRKVSDSQICLFYEVGVKNPDKGNISLDDVLKRVKQFFHESKDSNFEGFDHAFGPYSVAVTSDEYSRFLEKSFLFPGSTFIVGFDTAVRIIDKKYYNASEEEMLQSLRKIKSNGCGFIVFGRLNKESNVFETFDAHRAALSNDVQDMFHVIHEHEFRQDLSSTEIRAKLQL